jgi:pyrroloquinoline quinone (PQQ) biosynthesis protein C
MRRRFSQAERLSEEIARLREARRFGCHPFLERWFAGELMPSELQAFAAEHHHAVVALAGAARRAAALAGGLLAEELTRYADDQEDCIQLWCEFAVATGWPRSAWYFAADPLPQTVACSRAWSGENRPLVHHLVTIHAIESAFAQLAPRQLDALIDRYGFDRGSTRYFARRSDRAAGSASLTEAALTSLLPIPAPAAVVGQADAAYRGYWTLLDGVHRLCQEAFP